MAKVKPKKHLGQHFLSDLSVAQDIVALQSAHNSYRTLVEVGPGMGVLTQYLADDPKFDLHLVELDRESIKYLYEHYPTLAVNERIIECDFLKMDLKESFGDKIGIIGNFPYNISSQIFFKVLDHLDEVMEVVCMLQKEVAERIASKPGNKSYGILSVLLQAYYDITYHITVPPHVFVPPPKVQSGVISLRRNNVKTLPCDPQKFKTVIKVGFNQRRKKLSNALKPLELPEDLDTPLLQLRAEQLSVDDFITLTNLIYKDTVPTQE